MKKGQDLKSKHIEWQEHQYDPGYYTGGRQHYSLDNPGRSDLIGKFIILIGIIQFLAINLILLKIYTPQEWYKIFFLFCGTLIYFLLNIVVALKMIKKAYTATDYQLYKKALKKKIVSFLVIIIVSVFIYSNYLLEYDFIVFEDLNNTEIIFDHNDYYLKTERLNFDLKLDNDEIKDVDIARLSSSGFPIKIYYKKSILNSKYAVVTHLEFESISL